MILRKIYNHIHKTFNCLLSKHEYEYIDFSPLKLSVRICKNCDKREFTLNHIWIELNWFTIIEFNIQFVKALHKYRKGEN